MKEREPAAERAASRSPSVREPRCVDGIDDGLVIGAVDGDGDGLSCGGSVGSAGVIGGDDAVGERDRFASGEEVEVDVGVVGPAVLRRVDGEAVDQIIDLGRAQLVGEGASGPVDGGVGCADGDDIGGIELCEGEGAGG